MHCNTYCHHITTSLSPSKTRILNHSKNTIKPAFHCYLSAGKNEVPPGNKYSGKYEFQALKSIRNRIPRCHSEECC